MELESQPEHTNATKLKNIFKKSDLLKGNQRTCIANRNHSVSKGVL